jgi:hypothetical protein
LQLNPGGAIDVAALRKSPEISHESKKTFFNPQKQDKEGFRLLS